MTWWFRARADLLQDKDFIPSTHISDSQTRVTAASKDTVPSSGVCGCLHACVQIHNHIRMQIKNNKSKSLKSKSYRWPTKGKNKMHGGQRIPILNKIEISSHPTWHDCYFKKQVTTHAGENVVKREALSTMDGTVKQFSCCVDQCGGLQRTCCVCMRHSSPVIRFPC